MRTVEPFDGESVRGLLVRLAEKNLSSANHVCQWLGLPSMGQPLDVLPEGIVAALPVQLVPVSLLDTRQGEQECLLGQWLPAKCFNTWCFRLCPGCFSEAPYHRRIWDLRLIDGCPVHRCLLVARCPSCERNFRWARWSMTMCPCGHDLRDLPYVDPGGDWSGTALVYRWCGAGVGADGAPTVFDGLPVAEALDVLFFLGRTAIVLAQGNPDGLAQRELETDRRVLEAGAQIIMAWPEAFHQLAEQVRFRRTSREALGIQAQYGALYRYIARHQHTAHGHLLREEFLVHLRERGDLGFARVPGLVDREELSLGYVGPEQARQLCGLGWRTFAAVVQTPLWANAVRKLGTDGGRVRYARQDVEVLANLFRRLISFRRADQLLGIGRGKAAWLVESGVLQGYDVNRSRKAINRSVDRADVEALLAPHWEWRPPLSCMNHRQADGRVH